MVDSVLAHSSSGGSLLLCPWGESHPCTCSPLTPSPSSPPPRSAAWQASRASSPSSPCAVSRLPPPPPPSPPVSHKPGPDHQAALNSSDGRREPHLLVIGAPGPPSGSSISSDAPSSSSSTGARSSRSSSSGPSSSSGSSGGSRLPSFACQANRDRFLAETARFYEKAILVAEANQEPCPIAGAMTIVGSKGFMALEPEELKKSVFRLEWDLSARGEPSEESPLWVRVMFAKGRRVTGIRIHKRTAADMGIGEVRRGKGTLG
jgi:hypothetical protein